MPDILKKMKVLFRVMEFGEMKFLEEIKNYLKELYNVKFVGK